MGKVVEAAMRLEMKMFLNGEWVDASSGRRQNVISPATGEIVATVPEATAQDMEKAIEAARKAFDSGPWPLMTPGERASILLKAADLVEQNVDALARLESINQGKTIKQSKEADFPFGIDNLRFFAGAARALEGRASMDYMGSATSLIRREPMGVVGCITPWNYPWMMAVWKTAPALAAGNTVVIKPASLTPLTTLEFAKLFQDAGLPDGVLNVVTGPGEFLGCQLADSPYVDMISLTGATDTGKIVLRHAAETVKKVHLELGGKAPFIVFEDADLEAAAEGAVVAGFVNGGQDCTQACRFYVHNRIYDRFLEKLLTKTRTIRIGDPLSPDTDLGPLVSSAQREKVEEYVKIGKLEGARLVAGGARPSDPALARGFFHEPTIFTDASQKMRIVQEEIFGPVLVVLPFSTIEEVIEKANDTIYGLYSSLWTSNIQTAFQVANALRFGAVGINDHLPLASEMPHGGYKQSGYGKDLSLYALEEYTQVKHIFVDLTGVARKPWHYTVYGKP